jgi:hypothetical protein
MSEKFAPGTSPAKKGGKGAKLEENDPNKPPVAPNYNEIKLSKEEKKKTEKLVQKEWAKYVQPGSQMSKDDGFMFLGEVTQLDVTEKEWDKMAVDKEAGGIPLEFITIK